MPNKPDTDTNAELNGLAPVIPLIQPRDPLRSRSPEDWNLFIHDYEKCPTDCIDDSPLHTDPVILDLLRRTALALDNAFYNAVVCFQNLAEAAEDPEDFCPINAICRAVAENLPQVPLVAVLPNGELFQLSDYWDCVLIPFADAVYEAVIPGGCDCFITSFYGECYQEHCQDVLHDRPYIEYDIAEQHPERMKAKNANKNEEG